MSKFRAIAKEIIKPKYSLHSGPTTFDEQITIPLPIKFPGIDKKFFLGKQFSQESIKKVVELIMTGKINRHNFKNFVNNNFEDDAYIYSRNCSGDIKSILYKNEWKLIAYENSGNKNLYQL